MRRTTFACPVLVAAALGAAPAAAQSRLVEQYVRGWQRVCVYEMLMPVAGARPGERRRAIEVGRAEPCPARYSRPEPPPRRTAAPRPQGTTSR